MSWRSKKSTSFTHPSEEKAVIESKVDPKEWQKEVERAAQKIKIVIKPDAREWR